jgi:hypothetical protein
VGKKKLHKLANGRRNPKEVGTLGGIVPILHNIEKCGIPTAIKKALGKRPKQSIYTFDDVLLGWVMTSLCQGKRILNIEKYAKQLKKFPIVKIPSHDTIGRVLKSLATDTVPVPSVSGWGKNMSIHMNEVNENELLIRLLIEISIRSGALRPGVPYTLHIDATFIPTNCRTSKKKEGKTKKKPKKKTNDPTNNKYGFNPMICLINNMPVYISMRNGDVNSIFQIKECLERCMNILADYNITVGKVISDGAGYTKELVDMLHSKQTPFNIHMHFNTQFKTLFSQINSYTGWRSTTLETANHFIDCEVGEIPYTMHTSVYQSRVILARRPTLETIIKTETSDEKTARLSREAKMQKLEKEQKLKPANRGYTLGEWKEYNGYYYKTIITNDWTTSREDLVLEYNSRGNAEKKFDFMKNDFGWRYPPFMRMSENTVFMIVAAMANNIYRGLLLQFSKQIKQLRTNMRFPAFFSVFVDVACWFDPDSNYYEFYDHEIAYEKILN